MQNVYYQFKKDIGGQASKYIDQLDIDGQIDRDGNSDPYVTGYEKIDGTNLVRINLSRDGKQHSVVMNPRARTGPERSTFDPQKDTWKRTDTAPQQTHPTQERPGGERMKRQSQAPQQTPRQSNPDISSLPPTTLPRPQNPTLQGQRMRRESYEQALAKMLR